MIFFHLIDGATYTALRLMILKNVEENGVLKKEVYVDSAGIPTIGLGMNLRDDKVREEVLDAILGNLSLDPNGQAAENAYRQEIAKIVSQTYSNTNAGIAELRNELNKVMIRRANDPLIPLEGKRTTFAFANELEIEDVFRFLAQDIYESRIDAKIADIPLSTERAVLFSLAYNNADLIGPKLISAILNGERAEAWYEIRYNSNKGSLEPHIPTDAPGLAKRRYYESQNFNLYDSSLTEEGARAVFRMHQKHRQQILDYDNRYGDPSLGGRDMIAQANADFHVNNFVQYRNEAYMPARNYLTEKYSADLDPKVDLAWMEGGIQVKLDGRVQDKKIPCVRSRQLNLNAGGIQGTQVKGYITNVRAWD